MLVLLSFGMKITSVQRINITESEEKLEIVILPWKDLQKQQLFNVWIVSWTLIGLFLLYEILFVSMERNLLTYLMIWFAFWAYLEFKTVGTFRFRSSGKETITIQDQSLVYLKEIAGRGLDNRLDIEWIQDIQKINKSETSFFGSMSRSYWTLNNESLEILYKGKSIRFAQDLEEDDAQRILGKIKARIRQIKMKD